MSPNVASMRLRKNAPDFRAVNWRVRFLESQFRRAQLWIMVSKNGHFSREIKRILKLFRYDTERESVDCSAPTFPKVPGQRP